ncbi:hypothetical protein EYZ11_006471 [Aspergillus tanneri]|uniref:Uncharacterized protein n=1 Tax=Aspergillus tanneri TaxID=1220188 RepID=A0A4S3JFR5_9EURO|nr:hypothetical protein EYZ11_006471 [Aspergillus tanneri]
MKDLCLLRRDDNVESMKAVTQNAEALARG